MNSTAIPAMVSTHLNLTEMPLDWKNKPLFCELYYFLNLLKKTENTIEKGSIEKTLHRFYKAIGEEECAKYYLQHSLLHSPEEKKQEAKPTPTPIISFKTNEKKPITNLYPELLKSKPAVLIFGPQPSTSSTSTQKIMTMTTMPVLPTAPTVSENSILPPPYNPDDKISNPCPVVYAAPISVAEKSGLSMNATEIIIRLLEPQASEGKMEAIYSLAELEMTRNNYEKAGFYWGKLFAKVKEAETPEFLLNQGENILKKLEEMPTAEHVKQPTLKRFFSCAYHTAKKTQAYCVQRQEIHHEEELKKSYGI